MSSQCPPLCLDPLRSLGPSLFIHTLTFTDYATILMCERVSRAWRRTIREHEKGVWRYQSYQTGVELSHMKSLRAFEDAMSSTGGGGWGGDPEEPEYEPPQPAGFSVVNWRDVCKAYVALDRNWRFGRCRERFITPPNNVVWRMKVDAEQSTFISTSRGGTGLTVCDLKTSTPIFKIAGVRAHAHVEFTKGFVIFDLGQESDYDGLQVYRTQSAIKRSSNPSPLPGHKPPSTHTSISMNNPRWDAHTHPAPLPRGHLSFYRSIRPPTQCLAYRARLDNEGTENERAVLGTAGEEGVYIWDLDVENRMEKIPIKEEDRVEIRYIEFDEQFIFLCGTSQMHVFSRQTGQKLSSFPEDQTKTKIAYITDLEENTGRLVARPSRIEGMRSSPIGRLDVEGIHSVRGAWDQPGGNYPESFSACHYTPSDLICTALDGAVGVVRNYKDVFGARSAEERKRLLLEHTIWIDVGRSATLLSVHSTRVVVTTEERVIFFDTSTLPTTPISPTTPIPPIRLHTILSTHPAGVLRATCLQVDRACVYMTYWAVIEAEEINGEQEGLLDPETGERFIAPDEALSGRGYCVKVWDFSERGSL